MSTKILAGAGGIGMIGLAAYMLLRNADAVGDAVGGAREYAYKKTFVPVSGAITERTSTYRESVGLPPNPVSHEVFVESQPSPYKEAIQTGTAAVGGVGRVFGFAPLAWVAERGADYRVLINKGYIGKTAPMRVLGDTMWSFVKR